MPDLTPADRARLVKLLGLLASDHVGERAAAAAKAADLVKGRGLTWEQLLAGQDNFAAPRNSAYARYTPPTPNADLILCMRHMPSLRPWEQNFTSSLSSTLKWSPKQRSILADIAATLRARGLA